MKVEEGTKKNEIAIESRKMENERQGCGTLVEHDLLDDGVRLHELENMALDESNLEAMLFVDDGNGREENDTISGRQQFSNDTTELQVIV